MADRLEELKLLVAIGDGGSMAAGARATRRSPASVTRMVGELERRLGARLFDRSTRRLALTEAGSLLASHARALLAAYDEAVRDAAGALALPTGTLRVSAPLLFGRM